LSLTFSQCSDISSGHWCCPQNKQQQQPAALRASQLFLLGCTVCLFLHALVGTAQVENGIRALNRFFCPPSALGDGRPGSSRSTPRNGNGGEKAPIVFRCIIHFTTCCSHTSSSSSKLETQVSSIIAGDHVWTRVGLSHSSLERDETSHSHVTNATKRRHTHHPSGAPPAARKFTLNTKPQRSPDDTPARNQS
jgi:hypothetical protein